MELHYLINDTMRPLAEKYFLPSIPKGFELKEHSSDLWTSGNFDQDNYGELMIIRTDAIQREIETRLDGGLMMWCDIDIAFYRDDVAGLAKLAEGKDLLFQKEVRDPANSLCNFGVQVIRRNTRSLVFYARLALLQKISDDPHDQAWGNRLLCFEDAPVWEHLPFVYSSESNGGVRRDSVLYHANASGATDSIRNKCDQLDRAAIVVAEGRVEAGAA